MMTEVDQGEGLFSELLADDQSRAPILHNGRIKRRLEWFVFDQQPPILWPPRVYLRGGINQPIECAPEMLLAWKSAPIGQPNRERFAPKFFTESHAFEVVRHRL